MHQPAKKTNPLADFDPNERPKHPFATYCPARRGASFKLHANRGNAINALHHQGYGTLYAWSPEGRWVEIARVEHADFRPETCSLCKQSTFEEYKRWDFNTRTHVPTGNWYNRSKAVFERDSLDKLVEPLNVLYLCTFCARG